MSEANYASLASTLLARKGGAKPAMRPQSPMPLPNEFATAANMEDLGWNDMGDDSTSSDALSISPLVEKSSQVVPITPETNSDHSAPNQVRQSLDRIATQLVKKPTTAPKKAVRKSAVLQGKRAAFTLRLEQERHLLLRLACTVRGCSAQNLVTDALDKLLADMPEVAALAAQVKRDSN